MALTTGGSRVDLSFTNLTALQAAFIPDNRYIDVLSGSTYKTSATDLGEGLLLASGNYANPIGFGVVGDYIPKSADFILIAGQRYDVDGSSNTVDITLPATLSTGQEIIIHVRSNTAFKVQMLNPNFTIKGPLGVINPGTDMQIEAGQTAHLLATSSTVLEAI